MHDHINNSMNEGTSFSMYISSIYSCVNKQKTCYAALLQKVKEMSPPSSKKKIIAPLDFPLWYLYDEYEIPLYGDKGQYNEESSFFPEKLDFHHHEFDVAVSKQPAAKQALHAIEGMWNQHVSPSSMTDACKYLIYGHETLEANFYFTPAIYLKKKLKQKRIQPFSIHAKGSLVLYEAIQMCEALFSSSSDTSLPSLPSQLASISSSESCAAMFVVSDIIQPPMRRLWLDHYPKGDAATACYISPTHGDWKILHMFADEWPLEHHNPYIWSASLHASHQQMLLERSQQLLTTALQQYGTPCSYSCDETINKAVTVTPFTPSSRYVIMQHMDATFQHTLKATVEQHGGRVFTRESLAECNLLGSDTLYSLQQLEQQVAISVGDVVFLVLAGPIADVAILVLQKQ